MRRLTAVTCLAATWGAALAQGASPAAVAASSAEISASERAKRDAEKVFQWIRIHSDKPRKAAAPEKPAPVAAAPVKAARPAKAAESPVTEPVKSLPVAAAPARSEAPSRAAPEPVAAAALVPAPRLDAALQAAAAKTAAAPAVEEEDVVLKPIAKADPEFPASLMRSLRKGMVQVSFVVQPDGSVAKAAVVSATNARLGPTALATVAQWRFQPVPHPQQAVVDLGFNLD
ncbi:MAG TPA: TonB family protein [Albitalea sp.]|uniref:TonB family protein n=1 Tax=Piscinibacter sp. TaxID=1903157 RepID=UPI002ED55F5A